MSDQENLYTLIFEITDRAIQESLSKMPNDDLVLALINAPASVIKRVMENLSKQASALLADDIVSVREHGRVVKGEGGFRSVDNSDRAKEAARSVFFEILKTTDTLHTN